MTDDDDKSGCLGLYTAMAIVVSSIAIYKYCQQPQEAQQQLGTLLWHYKVSALRVAMYGSSAALIFPIFVVFFSRWRKIRVFISFQNGRENEADATCKALRCHPIIPFRMPFIQQDHDDVLAHLVRELRRADGLIVFPGAASSFVEHEVFTAALRKIPVMIVRQKSGDALPDTAYRGYPTFNAQKLEAHSYKPLGTFILFACNHIKDALHTSFWIVLYAILAAAAVVVANAFASFVTDVIGSHWRSLVRRHR